MNTLLSSSKESTTTLRILHLTSRYGRVTGAVSKEATRLEAAMQLLDVASAFLT